MVYLKAALLRQELSMGTWMTLAHPAIAEIMTNAGFRWIAIDLEHSVISLRETEELIRVIASGNATPLVRLTSNDANQIKRVMDAGAHGIIVPMVNSKVEAEAAVSAMYYPPRGYRGVGLARAQMYGAGFTEYRHWLETNAVVIVQIEHINAVRNLENILSVDGVDALIVGPYDLSASLGRPGDFEHSDFIDAMSEILVVAKRSGKAAGIHVVEPSVEQVRDRIAAGYRLIAYSVDIRMLDVMARGVSEVLNNE